MSARGFMVGEEAVTLDIVPLPRRMSDLGRLEDTMYLSMFATEEAKHTEMFRPGSTRPAFTRPRWMTSSGPSRQLRAARPGCVRRAPTKVMRRLDTDRSPQAILDATLIYHQFVEGVAAIARYHRWDWVFRRLGKVGGLEAGPKLTQREEGPHRDGIISDGVSSPRIPISGNGWNTLEKLTAGFGGGYGAASTQIREQRAASATTTNTGSG